MQLSRQGDYAIRTVLELAKVYPETLAIKHIATKQDIPLPFLKKIIQSLAKSGLVETIRGAQGGVKLWSPPEKITLRHIIEAIDGPITINRCLMGENVCFRQPTCAVHRALAQAKQSFLTELEKHSVGSLLAAEAKARNQKTKSQR
ncbi:RrF2 family transcriptional regulator [Calderihabitans maritimus]|uniref:BadM/Rrf2-like transcriptional regulator n=1 Tax=Calderihabitans maritimus TaxID=1246530 RepID=A0A1Z5HNU4_9FIRM|nr:Rrf2 family transcriptional regulator [Calderihabitans maritimus]GAW91196.1 BadM/Rrf2-like transcriptional regulator [Calderihabitans maritimus]